MEWCNFVLLQEVSNIFCPRISDMWQGSASRIASWKRRLEYRKEEWFLYLYLNKDDSFSLLLIDDDADVIYTDWNVNCFQLCSAFYEDYALLKKREFLDNFTEDFVHRLNFNKGVI